jgi:hypothetical protein
VLLNIDGLLLLLPNAPDEVLVRRKMERGYERDKPNVEPPAAGAGAGLEVMFPNIEFACWGCCGGFWPNPPPDPKAE